MDFLAEILFANSGAIFTTHLESQLRPIVLTELHISICWVWRGTYRNKHTRSKIGRSEPMEPSNAQTNLLSQ